MSTEENGSVAPSQPTEQSTTTAESDKAPASTSDPTLIEHSADSGRTQDTSAPSEGSEQPSAAQTDLSASTSGPPSASDSSPADSRPLTESSSLASVNTSSNLPTPDSFSSRNSTSGNEGDDAYFNGGDKTPSATSPRHLAFNVHKSAPGSRIAKKQHDCEEDDADVEGDGNGAAFKLGSRRRSSGKGTGLGLPRTGTGQSSSLHPSYERKVGFDTMDSETTTGGTGVEYSFTLQVKSHGFVRSKEARTFLVATDLNDYSLHALNWLLETLVEDGDELVVLRVIESGSSQHSLWKSSQDEAREEANEFLKTVMSKNGEDRIISITVEFVIGKVFETIQRMIEIYRPDSLIVGTRGRSESMWRTAFMGSTSKYCVAKSPVPVVVVRPEGKVRKSLEKRRTDPKRQSYMQLLDASGGSNLRGSGINGSEAAGAGLHDGSPIGRSQSNTAGSSRPTTASSVATSAKDVPVHKRMSVAAGMGEAGRDLSRFRTAPT